MHCESNSELGQGHSALTPARAPTGLCFSNVLGVTVHQNLYCSLLQHDLSPNIATVYPIGKKKKNKIQCGMLLYCSPVRCCHRPCTPLEESLRKAPISEPSRPTNRYLITAVSHCKEITHLHTFQPRFSSASLEYNRNVFYQERKDRPCTQRFLSIPTYSGNVMLLIRQRHKNVCSYFTP